MIRCCEELISAIENGDRCEQLMEKQRAFSESVENAMRAYKAGKILTQLPALPEVMYQFATKKLPEMCAADEEQIHRALTQLKLFLVTVQNVVKPELVDE